jgi:hypothetical protein
MPKEKQKKSDRKKKAGKKSSQLALRIEKSERDAFVELCDRLDTSAARELRRFMREFVAAHSTPADMTPNRPVEAEPVEPAALEPLGKTRTRKPRAAAAETPPQPTETEAPPPAPRKRAPRKATAA